MSYPKIQYASDLHMEYSRNRLHIQNNPIKAVGDILILAGDIIWLHEIAEHHEFFQYCADNFSHTYYIPGNHEFYKNNLIEKSINLHEKIRSNVSLVNNTVVRHGGVQLVLSTLWSRITDQSHNIVQSELKDFVLSKYGNRNFLPEHYNMLHEQCLSFLTEALAAPLSMPTIVATHHVPTFMNFPKHYKSDLFSHAFATELHELIQKAQPDYWIYGHTHENTPMFEIGKTKLVSNQLGYVKYGINETFRHDAVLTF